MRSLRELRRAHVQEAGHRPLHGAQHPPHQGNLSILSIFHLICPIYKLVTALCMEQNIPLIKVIYLSYLFLSICPIYKLVTALCMEHNIPLIKVIYPIYFLSNFSIYLICPIYKLVTALCMSTTSHSSR